MLKLSPKSKQRRDVFQKIGAALRLIGDPNVNDYTTGKPSKFHIANGASDATHSWDSIRGVKTPAVKTPQWVRTVK